MKFKVISLPEKVYHLVLKQRKCFNYLQNHEKYLELCDKIQVCQTANTYSKSNSINYSATT